MDNYWINRKQERRTNRIAELRVWIGVDIANNTITMANALGRISTKLVKDQPSQNETGQNLTNSDS